MADNLLAAYFKPKSKNAQRPDALCLEDCARMIKTVDSAQKATAHFERVKTYLEQYPGDEDILIAAADILERTRIKTGMLETWAALQRRFPQNGHALRMNLRWLRRGKFMEEGFTLINTALPDRARDVAQGVVALLAYSEMQAFGEMDEMMAELLPLHPDDSKLRILYAKNLMRQNRFVDAHNVVKTIRHPERLSKTPKKIIAEIEEQAAFQQAHGGGDVVGLLGRLIARFQNRVPRPRAKNALGGVVFYTGQLGAGGAERQLTRIAAQLERIRVAEGQLNGVALRAPIRVAIRHTNAESGADFFLPVLQKAGVDTFTTINARKAEIEDLGLNDPEFEKLLTFLPADVLDNTLRLVPYFRANNIEVAYLWQDGGILTSALAALIAEVPLIITSFRGLPPNLRPDLYRPQLEGLYRNLASVPGVVYSSNSMAAAKAYSAWVDVPIDRFKVLYNALIPASTAGDDSDLAHWQRIQNVSADCTKTVLGVFRFDPNKRPVLWVQTAAKYLETHPDTRFIVAGWGNEFEKCQDMIEEWGLQDRIFLLGRSSHVGFWLEKADVLLHLARYEGLPNVVIEAQIARVPVVVTPAGGTDEAMIHNETGYCLDSNDAPDMAQTLGYLDKMLGDPDKARQMGEAAHAFAKARFSPETALNDTLRLFMNEPD